VETNGDDKIIEIAALIIAIIALVLGIRRIEELKHRIRLL